MFAARGTCFAPFPPFRVDSGLNGSLCFKSERKRGVGRGGQRRLMGVLCLASLGCMLFHYLEVRRLISGWIW